MASPTMVAGRSTDQPISLPDSVESLTIHTGNIINWNDLKRKTTQTVTDELAECLGKILSSWAEVVDPQLLIGKTSVECVNPKFVDHVDTEMRKDLKVTVKILLCQADTEGLHEAINKVIQVLNIEFLESVIVSFPIPQSGPLELINIQPLWMVLESYVASGKVLTIGVSDMDTDLLISLFKWATIKPSTNQVNLASCCIMPPEMTAFAKDHDIQLLTHNDPKEILPAEQCALVLREKGCLADADAWSPLWIVRYSVVVKCRGLIHNKGFLASMKRQVLAGGESGSTVRW